MIPETGRFCTRAFTVSYLTAYVAPKLPFTTVSKWADCRPP